MIRILTLLLIAALLPASCEVADDGGLFTRVTVRFILPDDRPVERIEVLGDISYCRNINTREQVLFPPLDDRRSATLTLQKGVYTLIFEANIHYADGEVQAVRNADHNDPSKAVVWMDDTETVTLLLKYLH